MCCLSGFDVYDKLEIKLWIMNLIKLVKFSKQFSKKYFIMGFETFYVFIFMFSENV